MKEEFVCEDEQLFYRCEVSGSLTWIINITYPESIVTELTHGTQDEVGHTDVAPTSVQALAVLYNRDGERLFSTLFLTYSFDVFGETGQHYITCRSSNDSDTLNISTAGE